MIGVELEVLDAAAALRVVRALGAHRYVAGRLHLVHAFAFASASAAGAAGLEEAAAWAARALSSGVIDVASRDERLWRRATDGEVLAVLEAFWTPGEGAMAARRALEGWLARAELPIPESAPFDEAAEEDIHPLLVDAGWELLPLAQLDPERHKGAIGWFGDPIYFEAARFDEESAIPPTTYLHELPGIGPVELLRGVDENGQLAAPLVVWTEGNETYHEYVLAGVRRAAKIG